jgi:hypothetical protein
MHAVCPLQANLEVIDLRGGSDGEASPHMKHRGKKPDGEGKTGFKRPGPGRPKMGASQSGQKGEKNGGTGASRQLSKEGAKAALKKKEQKAGSDNQKRGTRAGSADLTAEKRAGGDSKRLGDAGTEDAGKAGKPTKTKVTEKGASGKLQLAAKTKKGTESGASSVASKGKVLKKAAAGQQLDRKGAETSKPPSGDPVAKAGSQLEQAHPLRMSESTGSGKDGGVRKRKLVKLSLSEDKAVGRDKREAKRGRGESGKIKGRELGRLLEDAEQAAPDTPRTRSTAGGAQTGSGVSSEVQKVKRRGPGRPPKAKASVGKPAETQSLKKGRDANRVLRKSKMLPPRGASKVLKKEVGAKGSSEQGKPVEQKSKSLLKGLKAKRPQEKGATTELSESDEQKAGAGTASREEEDTAAGESNEKGGKAVEGAASKEGEYSDKEGAADERIEQEGASKEGGSLENGSTADKITEKEAGKAMEEAEASEQKDEPEEKTQEEPSEQPQEGAQGDPSNSETESDDIGRDSKVEVPAPKESDAEKGGKEILAEKEDAPETEPDRNGAGGSEELKGAEQPEQLGALNQTEDVPLSAEALEAGPSAVAKVEGRAAEAANMAEKEGQKEMKEEEKPAASAENEPSGEQKDALRSSPALTNAPRTAEDGDKAAAAAPVEKASAAAGGTEAGVPPETEAATEDSKGIATTEAAAEDSKGIATTEPGTLNLQLELEEGEESGGEAEDQEEAGKETRPEEQAETGSGERESKSEEEGGETGQENGDGEKTPEASGRSGGEAEEPKVPEDRVATRGLGRRERAPVKRSWDEEEILPQRTKVRLKLALKRHYSKGAVSR